MSAEGETVREVPKRTDQGKEGVDEDHYYPEFGRAHLGIGQLELLLQMGVYADVDGHQKVHNQGEQGNFKVD